MSITEDSFDGGVRVGDRTMGSRGAPALTAPESLTGAEDYRARHKMRNGQPVTLASLAIKRVVGETILPPPEVMAQVQRINRARQAPTVPVDADDDFGPEMEEAERPAPRRRRRAAAEVRVPPIDFFRDDEPLEAIVAQVPTIAYMDEFAAKMVALIEASERRVIKRVRQMIDAALEEVE